MRIPSEVRLVGLLAIVALLWPVSRAEGTVPLFKSSMGVQCVASQGASCSKLRFLLDVDGSHRVFALAIENTNLGTWDFDSIESITGANGTPVTWWTKVLDPRKLQVEFAVGVGRPAAEPIEVVVNLGPGSTGAPGDVGNGDFRYAGTGYQGSTGYDPMRFNGTAGAVTPEPVTMALLATGLAGLGGVGLARRRRGPPEG